jgi:hypothetical protein
MVKIVQTQYGAVVKALRSDNGIAYINKAFEEYLSAYDHLFLHTSTKWVGRKKK